MSHSGGPSSVHEGAAGRARLSTRTAPPWFRAGSSWALVCVGLLLAWTTQVTPRLQGGGRIGAVVVALPVAALTLMAVLRAAWWRAWAVRAWVAFWGIWALTLPLTMRVAAMPTPDPIGTAARDKLVADGVYYPIAIPSLTGKEEITQLALAAILSTVLLILSRGSRRGLAALRAMWLVIVLTTAPVGIRDVLTDQHIVTNRFDTFIAHAPYGPFQNPNNFACVLAAAVGVLALWCLDSPPRWLLPVLAAAVAVAVALIWVSGSRAAFAATLVQLAVAVGLLIRRRQVARGAGGAAVPRRRLALGAGLFVAAALAASFLVPALRARNPLLRAAEPAGTATYDDLRLALTRTGLRYLGQHPIFGTGAGTFETRIATEVPAGVSNVETNMHNAFVELASQYGLIVFLPFLALLALLTWYAVRPASHPGDVGAPIMVARAQLACLLLMVVVTGIDVSSALSLPMWFVMMAHATALGWWLRPGVHEAERRPGPRPHSATPGASA